MQASPSKVSAERRQLIRPSPHIPWSVDVVSAVPKDLVEKLPLAAAGASCGAWACLALRDGYFRVWQPRTKSLSEPLEPSKEYVKLYLPDLMCSDEETPLVALQSVDRDSALMYAAHPTSGILVLCKISRKDLKTKLPMPRPHTKVRIPMDKAEGETLTTLTAQEGMVALGTAHGTVYWVTHTSVPVGLHVQKVEQSAGLLSRIFSTGDSRKSAVAAILPLDATEFLVLTKSGIVFQWKVTPTVASSHHAFFQATSLGNIAQDHGEIRHPSVVCAQMASDKETFHCLVTCGNGNDDESTLQWLDLHFSSGKLVLQHAKWLSRFADPTKVEVTGLACADNGNAYAAFSYNQGAVIVMVLLREEGILQEVDLPMTQVPSLLPNMLVKDMVTHGCSAICSSGIGVRVRFLPQDVSALPPTKRTKFGSNPSVVQTLVSHLRSVFWQSYQELDHLQLPPSLTKATLENLEEAIVAFCTELQYKGDASSAQNPLEWHKALIKLLQEGGLYRSLSYKARWRLLSIGQELAVFFSLPRSSRSSEWHVQQFANLQSHEICDWLLDLQTSEIQGGWEHAATWNEWLCASLEAATAYREEFANPFYDVVAENPQAPMWTSTPALQTVLLRQMEHWKRDPTAVELAHVESVVRTALISYSESYKEEDENSKSRYAKVKTLAISLLRLVSKGDDELAFDLSIQYNYFEGLCQMSIDHEKKRDGKSYSLDPLFATMQGKDLLTGYTVSQFVLQWHTDAGLYGHAINYGQHSTEDLDLIMKMDERLRPYRWVCAIRQDYYTQATESCLDNCKAPESTLAANLWALSFAKLSNKLEATRNNVVLQRQNNIERKLELVNAQQLLLEGEDSSDVESSQLLSPEDLISMAMTQLAKATNKDDRVRLCLIGLAVCTSLDDAASDQAAHVWAQTLQLDWDLWMEWIRTQNDLTDVKLRAAVLDNTVFGALLMECRKDEFLREVTFGRHIDSKIMDKLGERTVQRELLRLLHSAISNTDSMSAESLVVSSY